jgi:hypothetical protein
VGGVTGVSEPQPSRINDSMNEGIILGMEYFIFHWIKSRENSLMSFVIFLLFEFFKSNFVGVK